MVKRRTLAESLRYFTRLREIQQGLRSCGTDDPVLMRYHYVALDAIGGAITALVAEMRAVMATRSLGEACQQFRLEGRIYAWNYMKDAPDVLHDEPIEAESIEV